MKSESRGMSNINNAEKNSFLHRIVDGLENAASRKTNFLSFSEISLV